MTEEEDWDGLPPEPDKSGAHLLGIRRMQEWQVTGFHWEPADRVWHNYRFRFTAEFAASFGYRYHSPVPAAVSSRIAKKMRLLYTDYYPEDDGSKFCIPAGTIVEHVRDITALSGPLAIEPLVVLRLPDGRKITAIRRDVEPCDG